MSATGDLPPQRWGPQFLRLASWPYRAEYAVASVAILVLLFGGRLGLGLPFNWSFVGLVAFWFVWPDLAAFIPIGVAGRSGRWPRWGAVLYDVFHSFLPWLAVFTAWSVLAQSVPWALLGWALHITADRSFGYYLRAPGHEHGAAPPAPA